MTSKSGSIKLKGGIGRGGHFAVMKEVKRMTVKMEKCHYTVTKERKVPVLDSLVKLHLKLQIVCNFQNEQTLEGLVSHEKYSTVSLKQTFFIS